MRQEFNTKDVLRLEIQEGWGSDLPNLVENPTSNPEEGSWGWDTAGVKAYPDYFWFATSPGGIAHTRAYQIPEVTSAGTSVRTRFTRYGGAATSTHFGAEFLDVDGELISSALIADPNGGVFPRVIERSIADVPVGTRYVRIVVKTFGTGISASTFFNDVVMVVGPTAEVAAATLRVSTPWADVLSDTSSIDVDRQELNASELRAQIISSELDPATNDLITPGRRCRLRALVDGKWESIFTGELNDPSATYELKDPTLPDVKRTLISLFAVDAAAAMANTPQPSGVGVIDDLPAILLPADISWNVNGNVGALDPDFADVVARNENATVLDQLAITRDSALGYAWVDRKGTVQAWDGHRLSTTAVASIDEGDYSDLNVGFDLEKLINVVAISYLRINPGTGETEQVEYGPYVDESSIRRWRRRRKATFTIQGIDEAQIPTYAQTILDTNATPAKRIKSLTIPLRTVGEMEAHALRDLYDLVETSNTRAGILNQRSRVTSVKHRITAGVNSSKWMLEVGFTTDGVVASPQVTPSPSLTGNKTMAQLLRPVGEVTQWYGAKADCPAGWLVMDGSTFDGAQYPDLAARLGSTTLPDMTDRFPIGAGNKGLGTSGGSPTVTLNANHLPPHTHAIARQPSAGTNTAVALGGAGTAAGDGATKANVTANDPVDILNPWRALWFIIRAA